MNLPRFDDAVPEALRVLDKFFGSAKPETTLVRDASGALSIVLHVEEGAEPSQQWDVLASELHECLGGYSPGLREVLLRPSDLIDPSDVFASPDRVRLPDVSNTWLVDRLLTNQDWLRAMLEGLPALSIAAAFSIKGGVGRSTAFALWAWYLARAGYKVVIVDLDLESPGIGGILLDKFPDYGLADWLMESLTGNADAGFLQDCLMESRLAHDANGTLRILPAFGEKSQNYVAKLGRIYMPSLDADGRVIGFAERMAGLIKALAAVPDPPDVVLLDARAGLHDIGSAAVTRLGAEVFLFGRDDEQSWKAYTQLFLHLRSAKSITWGMPDEDLRWRLKMVAAQIDSAESARIRLLDSSYDAWSILYDADEECVGDMEPQIFGRDEPNAPHYPLFIPYREEVKAWRLTKSDDRPDWETVESVFGGFFAQATARLLKDGKLKNWDSQ
jgi:hypothetical protein